MKTYFSAFFRDFSKAQLLLFWIIIFVATFLRLYTYLNLSYYNDELSALVRVQEAEFKDLIAYGENVNDEHPMLVQGFLFVWTSIVGFQEWIVKLPYLILGFATLFLLFELTKKWTKSVSSALLVMAFFSVMQLHNVYSQSIRMYITGLFFMLLFVKHLFIWLESVDHKVDRHYALSVFMLALIGYNHHIGMLGAVIFYLCSIFYLKKSHLKLFLLLPILSFILYLPIAPMTYQQVFGYVGLSWMGQPAPGILKRFVLYLFHFNWFYLALVLVPFLIGLFLKKIPVKKLILSTIPFVLSFIILVAYTKYVAPIYQNHLLFFTLPFAFMLIFSVSGKLLGEKLSLAYVCIILSIGSYSLVNNRKHLELFPKQPYGELKKDITTFLDSAEAQDSLLVIHNLNTRYSHFYFKDLEEKQVRFIELSDSLGAKKEKLPLFNPDEFVDYKGVVLLNTPLYINNKLAYQYEEHKKPFYGFAQTKYYYKRKENPKKRLKSKQKDFDWEIDARQLGKDTISFLNQEFGLKLNITHNNKEGAVTLKFNSKSEKDYLFVLQSIEKHTGETKHYTAKTVSPNNTFQDQQISFVLPILDTSSTETMLYLWNNKKTTISLTDLNVELYYGNVHLQDKKTQFYLPETEMEYDPRLNYAFSMEVKEKELEETSFIYMTISCQDTTHSFYGSDFKRFPEKKGKRTVGVEIRKRGEPQIIEGCKVKFGAYNPGSGEVLYMKPVIKTYARNPYYYGIVEDLGLEVFQD